MLKMFKAILFGFLVGVFFSQQVQDWSADGIAAARQELRIALHIDAYNRIAAALQ
jgi:hypothetical protein